MSATFTGANQSGQYLSDVYQSPSAGPGSYKRSASFKNVQLLDDQISRYLEETNFARPTRTPNQKSSSFRNENITMTRNASISPPQTIPARNKQNSSQYMEISTEPTIAEVPSSPGRAAAKLVESSFSRSEKDRKSVV